MGKQAYTLKEHIQLNSYYIEYHPYSVTLLIKDKQSSDTFLGKITDITSKTYKVKIETYTGEFEYLSFKIKGLGQWGASGNKGFYIGSVYMHIKDVLEQCTVLTRYEYILEDTDSPPKLESVDRDKILMDTTNNCLRSRTNDSKVGITPFHYFPQYVQLIKGNKLRIFKYVAR